MSPRWGSCSNDSLLASIISPLRGLMKGQKNHFTISLFRPYLTSLIVLPKTPNGNFTPVLASR